MRERERDKERESMCVKEKKKKIVVSLLSWYPVKSALWLRRILWLGIQAADGLTIPPHPHTPSYWVLKIGRAHV